MKKGKINRELLQAKARRIDYLIGLNVPDVALANEIRLFITQAGQWYFKTINRLTVGINELRGEP